MRRTLPGGQGGFNGSGTRNPVPQRVHSPTVGGTEYALAALIRELKAPLQGIRSCTELIRMRIEEQGVWEGLPPDLRQYITDLTDQILRETARCSELLHDPPQAP